MGARWTALDHSRAQLLQGRVGSRGILAQGSLLGGSVPAGGGHLLGVRAVSTWPGQSSVHSSDVKQTEPESVVVE